MYSLFSSCGSNKGCFQECFHATSRFRISSALACKERLMIAVRKANILESCEVQDSANKSAPRSRTRLFSRFMCHMPALIGDNLERKLQQVTRQKLWGWIEVRSGELCIGTIYWRERKRYHKRGPISQFSFPFSHLVDRSNWGSWKRSPRRVQKFTQTNWKDDTETYACVRRPIRDETVTSNPHT
jgi:hypothetical protein